jgi:hypothetical protein
VFEVEAAGGVAHGGFHLGDALGQLGGGGERFGGGRLDLHRVVVAFVHGLEQLVDVRADGLRRDPVLDVEAALDLAPAVGLAQGLGHRFGHLVGVHDDLAVHVARGPARGLDERGGRAQVAFLVGVEDGHQGHLGDVQPLAQQVDADHGVELAEAEIADQRDAVQGVDVGVQVPHPEAQLLVVLG